MSVSTDLGSVTHRRMDPLMLLFLLIAGLTGADSVSTVSRVSAWTGGSATLSCSYADRYKTHVKYWCKGLSWSSCTPIVSTDSPQEGKVSIRDDPDQRVFTVTINNLTTGDSDYYSCGVKINERSESGTWVKLSVTDGVSTVNTVTVQRGGSVTIPCFYGDRYKSQVKYWCRGKEWWSCTPIVYTDSPQEGKVSVRDDPDQQVFTVTINNLTTTDSGYFWCSVRISGGSDPGALLDLSVTEETIKLPAPGSTPTGANDEWQSLFLYVGLGSLVLLLIIIIITWKVWDKHKKKMVRSQDPGSTELTVNPDHEYAAVDRTGIIEGAPPDQASEEPGADVTYSSIVLSGPEQVSSRCSSHHPAVTPASDVVYSSVALKHRE
ncbi:polymeric immunoglobulin receptor-like isoform X11 [Brienomyrus brachyistius]|uniref:polymeric immunoglobulin receptor-like isoform X11 n=1 Tax=Brienomyrus brachyistius TaxID=42636 RepID=UPI0020B37EC3|nr:polymeric immunoglobulin receptor-like isoform X11 [Brienomyrus brachyistius]